MNTTESTTLSDLEETIEKLKRCYQQGRYHDMPAAIERARSQMQALQTEDSDTETDSGLREYTKAEDLISDRPQIHRRIRKHATKRFSPLPDGSRADPDDWDIRWWMIEDGVLHYHVDHSDFSLQTEAIR